MFDLLKNCHTRIFMQQRAITLLCTAHVVWNEIMHSRFYLALVTSCSISILVTFVKFVLSVCYPTVSSVCISSNDLCVSLPMISMNCSVNYKDEFFFIFCYLLQKLYIFNCLILGVLWICKNWNFNVFSFFGGLLYVLKTFIFIHVSMFLYIK